MFCVLSLGLISLTPTGVAQTYGGSILTGDGNDPPYYKDYFDRGEPVHYYVYATEDGNYLQYKNIDILIMGPGGEVHDAIIFTDEFGEASGFCNDTGTTEIYTIYANYTGHNIANATIRVYEPIPSEAEVITYAGDPRESGGIPAYYFSSDDRVYFSIFVEDQWDNPYYEPSWSPPDDVEYWIYHNEMEVNHATDHPDDREGYIDAVFRPYLYFFDEDVFGLYQINITLEGDEEPLGSIPFEVVDVILDIIPSEPPYAQGEEITINIQTSILDTIDVQILDPDGDVAPNANWPGQVLNNGQWSGSYTFGLDLLDGNYELQVLKDGNLLENLSLKVEKYTLQIWTDSGAYLPGEDMIVYYTITNNKDGSGVTDATIEWIYEYFAEDDPGIQRITDSISSAGSAGTFQVSIPESAAKTTWGYTSELDVWANDTSGRSNKKQRYIYLGEIDASVSVENQKFIAGDFVVVNVAGKIETLGFSFPLRNGNVVLSVSKDGNEITSYTVNNLETDIQGLLTYLFVLEDDIETGVYTLIINVSKAGTNEWDTGQDTFEVIEFRELSVELGFDNKYFSENDYPRYYADDLITVTYTALRGDTIVENVNCEYTVYYENNYITAGTSSDGQFMFTAPEDFEGILTVYVEVTDSDGYKAYNFAYVDVARADLLLKSNMNEYLPGDTINVDYSVVGGEIIVAGFYYEVIDNHGNLTSRGSLTSSSGKFQFTVPKGDVPDSYTIYGYITDGNGMKITDSSVTIIRLKGFILTFTLDKNTYRPGETATLDYKITSVDGSALPDKFTLYYGLLGGQTREIETSNAEGSLTLKVPDEAADGVGFFAIESDLPYGQYGDAAALQQADIRANPNPLAETVFGDLSLLELILLVLVIISLLFGIAGWRRGKRALEEAKLPPWKKERPLPEPDKFKAPESEEPVEPTEQPPKKEEFPPPPPEDLGLPEPPEPPEPPRDMGLQ
jgi:hypothetical protein